jgi:predicted nucleotide-binding protein (sugar kinase/HSP70/actin superfamily)
MIIMEKYKVSFPQIGNYRVPMEILFTEGLDVEYIIPPPITKRTLELGSRYSPDYVCAPFKYTLGNFIETIEAGANTIVETGGLCRLGYYGELHEQILKDLGYEIRFVNMAKAQFSKPLTFFNSFKEINPNMSLKKIARILPLVLKMVEYMDEFEDYVRKNIGFEIIAGSLEIVHKEFLSELHDVRSKKQLNHIYNKYNKRFKEIDVEIPENPLRVGIIGEYYTIMEPFSNHYIEKELAQMGIVVDRWMNITNSVLHRPEKEAKVHIKNYANYDMGATSMYSIHKALEFAKQGYDGIIHVKSFGCTPEMDAMPVLQNISADYKIPILYFSFDSQTSDTGIKTRLEAFYDMIIMRKEASI